jgi:hypothetical protein
MFKKLYLLLFIAGISIGYGSAQSFVKTSDLLRSDGKTDGSGKLNIYQDPALDTLISRHILSSKKLQTLEGTQGMRGFRIQIYYSSFRNAREEASKAKAELFDKFPDLKSYAEYAEPGYFIVRAGDFRTKTEGFKTLLAVRTEFKNAYLVPAIINFPDLNTK